LFFRLRVFEVWLPPLRERMEDIPLLAQAFVREYAEENKKPVIGFTTEAMDAFRQYSWPGNVRELRTAVEHGVVLCRGDKVGIRDLPPVVRNGAQPGSLSLARPRPRADLNLKEAEKDLIAHTLKSTGGNRTLAAKKLGMSRRHLHRKLHDYNLEDVS
jgi:DNA-binding NtrC family response regulator